MRENFLFSSCSFNLKNNDPVFPYNGLEIDMLDVGDADAILVTRWSNGVPTRVLIDGGDSCDASAVKSFLLGQGIDHLDHILCTHPHDGHAAGLIGVVTDERISFGQFWMHLPWEHINIQTLDEALSRTSATRLAKIVNESLETSRELANEVWRRTDYIYEPFAGRQIGFLTVCGPSQPLYNAMLCDFSDLDRLAEYEAQIAPHRRHELIENLQLTLEQASDDGELGGEPTEPENDTSVVLATKFSSDVFVFAGDAGVPALRAVAKAYPRLGSCHWMQIPHHGSRRNINEELIEFFRPSVAFVSAAGTNKHPRCRVVNAFRAVGTEVFSTHYPDASYLRHKVGIVPPRAGYGVATSLYN
jgi:beta-lactamase superfamily II metal-dependent hydrolase